jgi:hypothetical protein
MKKVSLLLSLLFATALLFAQDSTVVVPISGGISDWISTHLGLVITLVLSVYEILARVIPTIKNYSIISFIVKILNQLVPNQKTSATSDTITKHID